MIRWFIDAAAAAAMTDEQLLQEWHASDGEGPDADALAAELEKRHLDP